MDENIVTIIVTVLTSGTLSAIVSALLNRRKSVAEARKLSEEADTEQAQAWRTLIAEARNTVTHLTERAKAAEERYTLVCGQYDEAIDTIRRLETEQVNLQAQINSEVRQRQATAKLLTDLQAQIKARDAIIAERDAVITAKNEELRRTYDALEARVAAITTLTKQIQEYEERLARATEALNATINRERVAVFQADLLRRQLQDRFSAPDTQNLKPGDGI